jgi:hypothetical protein
MEEDKILDTNLLIRGERGQTTILNIIEFPRGIGAATKILWPERTDYVLATELMIGL